MVVLLGLLSVVAPTNITQLWNEWKNRNATTPPKLVSWNRQSGKSIQASYSDPKLLGTYIEEIWGPPYQITRNESNLEKPSFAWYYTGSEKVQICQQRPNKPNSCIRINQNKIDSNGARDDSHTYLIKEDYQTYLSTQPVFRIKTQINMTYLCKTNLGRLILLKRANQSCTFYKRKITKPRYQFLTRIYSTHSGKDLNFNINGHQYLGKRSHANHKSLRFIIRHVSNENSEGKH